MSEPINMSVVTEIIAGISAIRTDDGTGPDENGNYVMLPERFPILDHAIEHFHAAIKLNEKPLEFKEAGMSINQLLTKVKNGEMAIDQAEFFINNALSKIK